MQPIVHYVTFVEGVEIIPSLPLYIVVIVDPESEDLLALFRRGYVLGVYAIFAVVVGNEPGAAEDGVERLVCCT